MIYENSYIDSLFETSQSLFWASFGLVDLMAFELQGIKSFTRFWAMLMFGSYSVINIIVLLNMLIAMMSNSYQIISVINSILFDLKDNDNSIPKLNHTQPFLYRNVRILNGNLHVHNSG